MTAAEKTAGEPTTIVVERVGAVGMVRLARPEARNAMSTLMGRELIGALDSLSDVAALVVGGDDRAFSAGADLKEPPSMVHERAAVWGRALDHLSRAPAVTVAAIEGYCLGGGLELALACDLRIAGEGARLGTPEVVHGVFPAGGGTQRLSHLVGAPRALELMVLGTPVDAATAASWGLVNATVPTGDAEERARGWAATIAGHDRTAVREILHLVRRAASLPLHAGLALEKERLRYLLDQETAAQPFNPTREECVSP